MAEASYSLDLASEDATAAFAQALGETLTPGDVVCLSGEIGAGKTFLARALIQSRLAALGRWEDVPSPTFTLVQVYDLAACDLWHVDLYRLSDPEEVLALGLDEAFETAICLVEWPDRLGPYRPKTALDLTLSPAGETARCLEIKAPGNWPDRLERLL